MLTASLASVMVMACGPLSIQRVGSMCLPLTYKHNNSCLLERPVLPGSVEYSVQHSS